MRVPLTKDGLNANHRQDKNFIDLHDRISEAYRGELGEDFQVKTKKRVDWIISSVSGKKVLDVGCSQGIVPMLLAKKGVKVTGVDIDQKAIDEAIESIKGEPKAESNVRFICADFLKEEFENNYDSVVMTEVLEHTLNPEKFIARAHSLTRVGGGIVVTVPFGINDHPDHRQNFYLVELYSLLSKYYDIQSVQIIEKWIGFSGEKRSKQLKNGETPSMELLTQSEEKFYDIERTLNDKLYNMVDAEDFQQVQSELDKLRDYTRKLWKRADQLDRKYQAVRSSASYKVGMTLTYVPRKLYGKPKIKRLIEEVYYLAFPNKRHVFVGADLRYDELSKVSSTNRKYFLKRTITPEKPLRMAAIMDDFTYSSFKYDAEITQLTPSGWREEIDRSNPDLLFIESAWRGVDTLWTNKIAQVPQELRDIVSYCRSKNIPTVFWNKEDPAHLAHFMRAASIFDFVFTTDADSIPLYQDILGHGRVYLLPFAAQPVFNNPIEEYERKDKFNFAGSYYRAYPERGRNFDAIMEAALQFRGVDIYDRNYDKDVSEKFRFPEKYQVYIKGSLPYSEIDKAYKGYIYAITLNTIKHSSTMFARRAFELVASNTVTVGNDAKGIKRFLGELTVASDDKNEIIKQLDLITKSELNVAKYRLLGLRRVMDQHTYKERVDRLMRIVFSDHKTTRDNNQVMVVAKVATQRDVRRAVDSYERQEFADKKLVLIADNPELEIPSFVSAVVKPSSRKSLAKLMDEHECRYAAVFDPGDFYGKFYLTDLVLATTYSGVDIIGKSSYFGMDNKGRLKVVNKETQYRLGAPVRISHSIISIKHLNNLATSDFAELIDKRKVYQGDELTLSIDGFNLAIDCDVQNNHLNDIEGWINIDQGADILDIYAAADAISLRKTNIVKVKTRKALRRHKTHIISNNPREA